MRSFSVALAALCAVGVSAQHLQEQQYAPIPYQFAYKAESEEGSHSQEETSDGNGHRQGSYTIVLADGRQRTVTYVADENGFRADVSTNELGTESKDAADVKYSSSAITGEQAALQYGVQQQRTAQAPASYARVAPGPVATVQSASAPIVPYSAPSPTVFKAAQSAAVIRTYTAAAPTRVRAVQSAPVSYAVAEQAQFAYPTHSASRASRVQGHDYRGFQVAQRKA